MCIYMITSRAEPGFLETFMTKKYSGHKCLFKNGSNFKTLTINFYDWTLITKYKRKCYSSKFGKNCNLNEAEEPHV
jgi:hypothetical protein